MASLRSRGGRSFPHSPYRKRGGVFGVIEIWIEGRQMMEILTPEMQAEYVASMNPVMWRQMPGVAAAA